jgi:hypothetical protein
MKLIFSYHEPVSITWIDNINNGLCVGKIASPVWSVANISSQWVCEIDQITHYLTINQRKPCTSCGKQGRSDNQWSQKYVIISFLIFYTCNYVQQVITQRFPLEVEQKLLESKKSTVWIVFRHAFESVKYQLIEKCQWFKYILWWRNVDSQKNHERIF